MSLILPNSLYSLSVLPKGLRGWVPILLPNVQLWLDSSDLATITEAADLVSQWNDKSINGRNFSQGTGSLQPIINDNGGISFDGVDDELVASAYSPSGALTFYCAFESNRDPIGGTDVGVLFSSANAGGGNGLAVTALNGFTTTLTRQVRTEGTGVSASSIFKTNGSAGSATSKTYSKNSKIQIGITLDAISSGVAAKLASFTGGFYWGKVKILELIIVGQKDTVANSELIEGYFAWKWGTELKLPYNHTYLFDSYTFGYIEESWYPTLQPSLVAWYDTADETKTTEAAGEVSQVDDKSSNGFDLAQGTGSAQPDNLISEGNHKVFNYDGGDAIGGAVTLPSSGNVGFYIIAKIGAVNNTLDSIFSFDGASSDFEIISNHATQFNGAVSMIGAATSFAITGGPYSDLVTRLYSVIFNFDLHTVTFYVNGVASGTVNNYNTKLNTSGNFVLMANKALTQGQTGLHGDVVITELVGDGDRRLVEGFLCNKYSIESSLPINHPFYNKTPRRRDTGGFIDASILTEAGDTIITEDSDILITE